MKILFGYLGPSILVSFYAVEKQLIDFISG